MKLHSIRFKMVGVSALGVLLTVVALVTIVYIQKGTLHDEIAPKLTQLVREKAGETAKAVYLMCRSQHESVQQSVTDSLKFADKLVKDIGQVSFSKENVDWDAVNQYSKQAKSVALPKMLLGKQWLKQNRSFTEKSLVVDEVQKVMNVTCTIFQRMNDRGDFLRVCTNVKRLDGTRAVGTYIPAINPDGKANPVIEQVLQGQIFRGRAYVVNAWYITAYKPLMDENGKVVGILYVGVQQENVKSLRNGIMEIVVGKTGYVYVFAGSGKQRGEYIISHHGKRDGENVWDAKDANGEYFIRKLIENGKQTTKGNVCFVRYPWKNTGEKKARSKIAAVTYFKEWDWVIGAGTYEDDYKEINDHISGSLDHMVIATLGGAMVLFVIVSLMAIALAGKVTKPLINATNVLRDIAQGEGDLTQRLPATSDDEIGELAKYFNEFVIKLQKIVGDIAVTTEKLSAAASALRGISGEMNTSAGETSNKAGNASASAEEVSKNIHTVATAAEEMSSSIKEIAENAGQATRIVASAVDKVKDTNKTITQLGESSTEIGNVIKLISSIAAQTNLLALNATIEAARAGDAGKGFAVVANEVKELAKETSDATEDIKNKILSIQGDSQEAVAAIAQVSEVIAQINDISNTIGSAVEEQTVTTNEIGRNVNEAAQGSSNIAQNITDVANLSQETSGNATNVSNSSAELSQMALDLEKLIGQFRY